MSIRTLRTEILHLRVQNDTSIARSRNRLGHRPQRAAQTVPLLRLVAFAFFASFASFSPYGRGVPAPAGSAPAQAPPRPRIVHEVVYGKRTSTVQISGPAFAPSATLQAIQDIGEPFVAHPVYEVEIDSRISE